MQVLSWRLKWRILGWRVCANAEVEYLTRWVSGKSMMRHPKEASQMSVPSVHGLARDRIKVFGAQDFRTGRTKVFYDKTTGLGAQSPLIGPHTEMIFHLMRLKSLIRYKFI